MTTSIHHGFFHIITRLCKPIRYLKGVFFAAVIFPFVSSALFIATIALTRYVVNQVQVGGFSYAQESLGYFIALLAIFLIVRIATKNYGYAQIWPYVRHHLCNVVLTEYMTLDNTLVEKIGSARITTILEKGIDKWVELLAGMSVKLFGQWFLTTLFALYLASTIAWYYGVLLLLLMISIIAVYVVTQNIANGYRKTRNSAYVEYVRDFVRVVASKFEIIQSNKLSYELSKVFSYRDPWYAFNHKVETMRLWGDAYTKLVVDGLKILTVFAVLYGLFGITLPVGDFLALMFIISLVEKQSMEISQYYIDATDAFVSVEKMRDLLDQARPLLDEHTVDSPFSYNNGDIVFTDVSFAYESSKPVFDQFNLRIPGGSVSALVGVSGSGKSTLAKLIAAYLRPDTGSLMIGNQSLSDISLKSYYEDLGYLTQEPNVFDGTIRENLLYGVRDGEVDEYKIRHIIELAHSHFIYELPDGLDTQIGERGVRLSGGQKQRLAIAKLLLRDPKIIILDEPTAALDSLSEDAVTKALHNLFAGRTVIIIAHRLQTVKNADCIFVLEHGVVVEQGKHTELATAGGVYQRMIELQSGFMV